MLCPLCHGPEAVTRIQRACSLRWLQAPQPAWATQKLQPAPESDLVQRFLNVLQPGTYVRPHLTGANNQGPVWVFCGAARLCWLAGAQ